MAASASPEPPRLLGDFEIIRELGRGGMGVVYEARQVSLNRKVALKVLASSLGLTSKSIERFHREAEAAAKLHHTNIVPVYATGAQDGVHFYAMELIEGPSLDRVIRGLRRGARNHRGTRQDARANRGHGSGGHRAVCREGSARVLPGRQFVGARAPAAAISTRSPG